MPSRKLNWCLVTLLLLTVVTPSSATHLRAVEIQVKRNDCGSLTVEIIITAYLNYHNTEVKFGGDDTYVDFGDGSRLLIPEIDHEIFDPDLFIGRVQYKTTHTYKTFGRYKVFFSERNRNAGILNFDGSGNTAFSTETTFLLDDQTCNSSPTLLVPPIDVACSGRAFFHDPAAVDPNGDSLSYELVVAQGEQGPVMNYLLPDNSKFYSGIPDNEANEEKNAPPSFVLDPHSGLITWDAPGNPGEYVIAIKITEWKYDLSTSSWITAGYMIRDMTIIVQPCDNQKPSLDAPAILCVTAGTNIGMDIPASDPDYDNVVIEGFSEVFTLTENNAVLNPPSGTLQSTNPPHDTASAQFSWQTTCAQIRTQPYKIVFKVSDRPATGPRLVRFYTLHVKVIAPAPEYEHIVINPVTKKVSLKWKDYPCDNVETFQVWRRISEFNYEPPECNTGMPSFLHYQLLAELPATGISYTDTDLAFGAQYCYRIVALIGDKKVPSRISVDTCFIPKPAEAPVILNVSVVSTNEQQGEVMVRWTSPFEIDKQQYPPPYSYRLLRKNESDPQSSFQPVSAATISDTVFTDTQLNTQAHVYRYQVELYVPSLTSSPVDTSAQASSVFASTQSIHGGINISWRANTPWYNYSEAYPYHLIYRSNFSSGPFILIDSVDVNANDFRYTDLGKYNDLGLTGSRYYYKVKTRGTYGNPKIRSPLENYSQITSGQVLDTIPPPEPVPEIAKINCEDFACDGSNYFTRLVWETLEPANDEDIVAYEVLVKDESDTSFRSLAIVSEKLFLHTNIRSLNKCYRVISIDQAGNRSDTSAIVCNSNCLRFKLPNVITPGVSLEENDILTTYPERNTNGSDCSRSVQHVDIRIYSRWGEEIYTTSLTTGEPLIFWDGQNSNGADVSSGTYFYHARVVFDTIDPSLKKQHFKGWVQVIR